MVIKNISINGTNPENFNCSKNDYKYQKDRGTLKNDLLTHLLLQPTKICLIDPYI